MSTRKKTVRELALEAGVETDEALLLLWDNGFDTIHGIEDCIGKRSLNRVRRILGLATRRELSDATYWQKTLDLSRSEFEALLSSLGEKRSVYDGRISARMVHRLREEAVRRGAVTVTRRPAVSRDKPQKNRFPTLVWAPVGHERDVRILTEGELLDVHIALVRDFAESQDPINPAGVRDGGLLSSAAHRPLTSLCEVRKYPTVETAGAALLHSLVLDHPFHNGNKRTALVALLVFLDENGLYPTFTDVELFRLVLLVAQHRLVEQGLDQLADREVLFVANWLLKNTRANKKGDKVICCRKAKQILAGHGCAIESKSRDGSKLTVTRWVEERGLFGIRLKKQLKSILYYRDDGRDCDVASIKRLREDLHLDDLHGMDSVAFYGQDGIQAEPFISKYRKILTRLAKL